MLRKGKHFTYYVASLEKIPRNMYVPKLGNQENSVSSLHCTEVRTNGYSNSSRCVSCCDDLQKFD